MAPPAPRNRPWGRRGIGKTGTTVIPTVLWTYVLPYSHLGVSGILEIMIPLEQRFMMVDESTKKTLSNIPLLQTKAGPRDKELWVQRLKEEYQALIKYVKNNKDSDNDWFRLESNKEGTKWFGKCWYIHNFLKYEFEVEFDIPVTYPTTAPEIALPELDGKTAKMYRGGKICLTDHFKPLWARNVPKFGIAHAMALGLGPWLAVEIPDLIEKGAIIHKDKINENKS